MAAGHGWGGASRKDFQPPRVGWRHVKASQAFTPSVSKGEHVPYLFCWIQRMSESLTVSRSSALKGLPIVARGKGAQRPPPRGWGRHGVSPSPRSPGKISPNALPTRGEGKGEWGRATNSTAAGFHPRCVQQPDLWVMTCYRRRGVSSWDA
jgi:hypothetical protein